MTAPVTVRERDLRALAGIVSEDRPDLPDGEGLPPSLVADLMGQIRCDRLSFLGFDSGRQETWLAQRVPASNDMANEAIDRAHWEHYWDCKPCSHPDRTGDLRSIVKIEDFYSARQWHGTGMYCDLYRPRGIEHELQLCLPESPEQTHGLGRTVRLYFLRGPGPGFSERDRAVLTLLRPHLHQAYLDARRRRHPAPRLTPRHWELLRLLAAGHTNIQIARRLGISEGTVRSHLEHIYERLHVSNRTAAVTRAFPTGSPSAHRPRVAHPGLPRSSLTGPYPHASSAGLGSTKPIACEARRQPGRGRYEPDTEREDDSYTQHTGNLCSERASDQ